MNYDVIVLGGGAIGANCAFELSKQGHKVALLEKRHFASGASGASAAMLELQIDAHRGEPFYSLSKASNELFPSLYEEIKSLTGIDFQFERCGILHLASSEEDAISIQSEAKRQVAMGLKTSWFSSDDLQVKFPYLNPTHFGAALYHEDGQVNGETFTSSLMEAARKKGAITQSELGEISFVIENGKVAGVRTKNEKLTAKKYLVAGGAWSDEILAPLNVKLGVVPIRGQLVIYDTPNNFLEHPIYTKRSGYLTPKRNGYTLAGTTVEQVGFDESTTEKAKTDIMKMACDLVPGFSRKTVRGVSAGLRPGSPDGLPFLGPLNNHENVLVAAGHYRNGILLSPITAQLISALVDDKKPSFDLTPFSPHRKVPTLKNT